MKKKILIALLTLLPLPASAATLFVSTTGCSDTPPSATVPYCTVQAAIDHAASGDNIQIHQGTYVAGVHTCGGTSGVTTLACLSGHAPIIIQGAIGEPMPTLDGSGIVNTGLTIWDTSNVLVKGIAFRNFNAGHGTSFTLGGAAINVSTSSGGVVDNITIDNIKVTGNVNCPNNGDFADITLGWSSGVTHAVLSNSYIESQCPYGVAIGTSSSHEFVANDTVANNTLIKARDLRWLGIRSRHSDFITVTGNQIGRLPAIPGNSGDSGLQVRDETDWTITNNSILSAGYVIHLFDEGGDGNNVEHHTVRGNTLDCAGSDIGLYFLGTNNSTADHNTIQNCGRAVYMWGDGSGTKISFTTFNADKTPLYVNSPTSPPSGYSIDASHDIVNGTAPPSPVPSPTSTPVPSPTPLPSPTPVPSPSPSPAPSPTPCPACPAKTTTVTIDCPGARTTAQAGSVLTVTCVQ